MVLNTKRNFNINVFYPAAVSFFRLVIVCSKIKSLKDNLSFEQQLQKQQKPGKKTTKISVSISFQFSCLHSINSSAVKLNKLMLERD